nr:hypothetical protein [Chloroflexota bacterium]
MTIKTNNEKDWRAERFVASLLALTSFGLYNMRLEPTRSARSLRSIAPRAAEADTVSADAQRPRR